MKLNIAWLLLGAMLLVGCQTPSKEIAEKIPSAKGNLPNIVVILADDIGLGDISFYNQSILNKSSVVHTNNIDMLAQQGLWFDDGHSATALCAPTRYSVMTGKNNYRSYAPWGVWGSFQKNAIENDEPTLANVVKPSGYNSGFIGKWHLGGDFKLKASDTVFRGRDEGNLPQVDLNKMVGGGPNDLGFDYSFMLPDGIQGPLYLAYENQAWYPLNQASVIQHITEHNALNPKIVSDKGDGMGDSYWRTAPMGELLANKATEFINKQDSDIPFLMYYASPMAHLPHIPPQSFNGNQVAGTTPSVHLDMVYELDLQIGEIIKALKANDFYDNTLIIFTSDNGGLTYRVPGTAEAGHKVSGIYRGSKNTAYEGGHRVPFIVSWPNRVSTPKVLSEPVLVQDLIATVAEASSNPLAIEQAPDSKSLMPLIDGRKYKKREYFMLQSGSHNDLIYREGDWKLIIKSDHTLSKMEPIALFNVSENPRELEKGNLIHSKHHKEHVLSLFDRYKDIRSSGQPTAH